MVHPYWVSCQISLPVSLQHKTSFLSKLSLCYELMKFQHISKPLSQKFRGRYIKDVHSEDFTLHSKLNCSHLSRVINTLIYSRSRNFHVLDSSAVWAVHSPYTLIRNSERMECLFNHSDNVNTCIMKITMFLR